MVDLNTSPHSEYERKVQRLYEAATIILQQWDDGSIVPDSYYESASAAVVRFWFATLSDALSAFDGKAFNEVKS